MKSLFSQNSKKKPPPRPPPPDFTKYAKKYLNQENSVSLIDWSPPNSPNFRRSYKGGSVSSSYSSSSSLALSDKKSLENESFSFMNVESAPLNYGDNVRAQRDNSYIKPRVIRSAPLKKSTSYEHMTDSPPMPKVPAPKLPQGNYDVITPYGIALFNFEATYSEDLALQANDVVELIRRVNGEWLYGRICDREGIFPEKFIQVQVPLPGENITSLLYQNDNL